MKRAFTLVELLVVIAIISILMAVVLPVARLARERGAEAVCQSNLHQMVLILKAYCNDHDNLFPNPTYIYHSRESFTSRKPEESSEPLYAVGAHPWTCRWHDARIGPASRLLLREHKEFQGDLIPYLGNARVLLCKTGARAYKERGCNQDVNEPRRPQPPSRPGRGRRGRGGGGGDDGFETDGPNEPLAIVPQYSYTMNGNLHRTLLTGGSATGAEVNVKTVRTTSIYKETQVGRSPSEVFAFGEENSWPINKESRWPASYNLSGPWGGSPDGTMDTFLDAKDRKASRFAVTGAITIGSLDIGPSYTTFDSPVERPSASKMPETDVGDAFATYHRPSGGDLNTGHSYVSMLDGHVQKVTVSDQLRKSREDPNLPPSRLGPGGNLHLAWPLDIPPLGGWENQ